VGTSGFWVWQPGNDLQWFVDSSIARRKPFGFGLESRLCRVLQLLHLRENRGPEISVARSWLGISDCVKEHGLPPDRCEVHWGLLTKSSDALDGGSRVGRYHNISRGADQMSMALPNLTTEGGGQGMRQFT